MAAAGAGANDTIKGIGRCGHSCADAGAIRLPASAQATAIVSIGLFMVFPSRGNAYHPGQDGRAFMDRKLYAIGQDDHGSQSRTRESPKFGLQRVWCERCMTP